MRGVPIMMAVLLATVGLAGCLGEETDETDPALPGDDGGDGQAPEQRTLAWGLAGCKVVVAIVPVDADALADHLPEGFTPVSAEEAFGLPPDPRGEGAIGVETFACTSGTGLNGTVQDLAYGAIFAPVEIPENLTHPEADLVLYKWETLVPDEPRRQVLVAEGLPAVDGATDLSGLEENQLGHTFDVSLTLGDVSFGFSGTAAAPNEDFREGLPFVEFQAGQDGYALWASLENEAEGANSGTGVLALPTDHWTTEVVGSETDQAYMVASTNVTFEAASIVLPG